MKPETAAELAAILFYLQIRIVEDRNALREAMRNKKTAKLPVKDGYLPSLKHSLADITRAIELLEKEN